MSASPEPPGKDEFARLMADRYRQGRPADTLHYDPDRFSLRRDGEPTLHFGLHSAYDEYCAASPEDRPAVVERYVGVWLKRDESEEPSLAEALPRLLPVVRARAYF